MVLVNVNLAILSHSIFLTLLWMQTSTQFTVTNKIIRGRQDRFLSHLRPYVVDNQTCDNDSQYCYCHESSGTFVWNNKRHYGECLSDQEINSRQFTGTCYQFSNGDHMRLLTDEMKHCTHKQEMCNEKFTIWMSGPGLHPVCSIDWEQSVYSADGSKWSLLKDYYKAFYLTPGRKEQEYILQMNEVDYIFRSWAGTLIKIKIDCLDGPLQHQSSCILLKVEGAYHEHYSFKTTPTAGIVSLSPKKTSVPKSTFSPLTIPSSTVHQTSDIIATNCVTYGQFQPRNGLSSSEITLIAASVVLVVLLAIMVVVFIFCRQKIRSADKSNEAIVVGGETNAAHTGDELVYAEPAIITTVPPRMQGVWYHEEPYIDMTMGQRKVNNPNGQKHEQNFMEGRGTENRTVALSPGKHIYDNVEDGNVRAQLKRAPSSARGQTSHVYSEPEEQLSVAFHDTIKEDCSQPQVSQHFPQTDHQTVANAEPLYFVLEH